MNQWIEHLIIFLTQFKFLLKPQLYKVLLFLLLAMPSAFANELIVMMKPATVDNNKTLYAQELVNTALKASVGDFGDYQLKVVFSTGNSERTKRILLSKGEADITFAPTSKHWEQSFITIRVPIFKGLLGQRVLVISKDQQALFAKITRLEELKALKLGSRNSWKITQVFKQTGFNVVEGSAHWSMYKMLSKGRFDFLPRGVYEVEEELNYISQQIPNLAIEQSLLLNVPLPAYFFVNVNKPNIAKRLAFGLEKIIATGQFDKIFNRYFGDKVDNLNLSHRKSFDIVNNALSERSAKNIANFWPSVTKLALN